MAAIEDPNNTIMTLKLTVEKYKTQIKTLQDQFYKVEESYRESIKEVRLESS